MIIRRLLILLGLVGAVTSVACGAEPSAPAGKPGDLTAALASITSDEILAHTRTLSSDEYEGRAPGGHGEKLTIQYLSERFAELGLQPGNPNGAFNQRVSLIGLTPNSTASFTAGAGRTIDLQFPQDYVAVTRRTAPRINVERSDVVFVGYGVVAPEYGWNDYKDVDVRGKTIVMLINDPPVPDPTDPTKLDEKMFKGNAMSYYGRWTYKYEIAAQKGAEAAIIVHETGPAGYPWEVVAGSWGHENFDVRSLDGNKSRAAVEAWIQLDRARVLFTAAGENFDTLKKKAVTREFRPVPLRARANFTILNTVRSIDSRNVIAKLEGSDPNLKNEYVVYTAHWDHLGRDPALQGDQTFNGALDNASGTAALLEIAQAYTKINPAPKRTMIFMGVTGEEYGLLGAKYYANAPLYPLEKTLADINIDGVNQWGRTKDIVIIGYGNSTLDDELAQVAGTHGRVTKPDPEPEKGYFYRSDHFEFAKKGVPALYTDAGIDYIGKPEGYGQKKRDEYLANDYHKVTDVVKPDWDLSGAVEDIRMLVEVGYRVAQSDRYPEWKPGTEFKARRDAMLAKK